MPGDIDVKVTPLTDLELARTYLYELFNDADHVRSLTEHAQVALEQGDVPEALRFLRIAERPAGLVQMRLRHAIEKVEAAK